MEVEVVSNWIINYEGLVVDYRDVTEGVINHSDGGKEYFIKLGDNAWLVVPFSRTDMGNPFIIEQINQAHARAGTKKVNKYFMELLLAAFPEKSFSVNDDYMRELFRLQTIALSSRIELESEKYRYVSEQGAVIVNGNRYVDGQTVYFNGHKYVVKIDGNGEGYLDLDEYPTGKGFIVTEQQRIVREVVHYLNYSQGRVINQSQGSGVFFDYTNGQPDLNGNGTVISNDRYVERRLRAPINSEIRYWECVDFTPGSRVKVSNNGNPVTLEEVVLTSKGTSSPQPSGDYGDWEVRLRRSDADTGKGKSGSWWVALKKIYPHWGPCIPTNSDATFFRRDGNDIKEVVVKNYFTNSSIRKRAQALARMKTKNYLSNDDIDRLAAEFGSTYMTFEQFVDKYRGESWLRAPKGWSNAPNLSPGSGTKTEFFGKFNISSGVFKIDVRYNTFLKYAAGGDTVSRGKAKLELIEYLDSGYTTIETLFDVDYNVGNYWDKNTDKVVSRNYKGKGSYGFKLTLVDTYQDTQAIYVRAQPTITEYTTSSTKEYDGDASFTFYIIDPSTGKRIPYEGMEYIVLKGKEDSFTKCFRVVIPKGAEWVIRGDLFKGNISTGGILGDGAAARLRDGVIKYDVVERIPPYIIATDESVGRILDLPELGWQTVEEEERDGEAGEKENPFFWVDVMEIVGYPDKAIPDDVYKQLLESATCYPKGVAVSTELIPLDYNGEEKDWSPWEIMEKEIEFYSINSHNEGLYDDDIIELVIRNPFDESIKVGVEFRVEDDENCGGGGFISFSNIGWEFWGRGDLIGEGVEELPTFVRIAITELVSNHEIIGGCPGCYAEVLIKDGDTILEAIKIDEEGWTDFSTEDLYKYDLKEFDIEVKTYQKGYVDPRGYDVRCMFILDSFNVFNRYELSAANFDSMLEFYINDEWKFSVDTVGEGEHYFPVKKGLNKYKFVFKTNNWDYNWDYVEIPWIRLTNWICDDVTVVPYCEPGGGDKCIEALIGCVLGLLPKKTGCVIVKHIDDETGEVMKQVRYDGYSKGEYTFYALDLPDFEVVGEGSKTVFVQEVDKCAVVEFYYRKLYRDCVYVIYRDITTGKVISKKEYSNLAPGEYIFSAEDLVDYEIVGESSKTIVIEYLRYPPEKCKVIYFDYRYIGDKNPYLDCVWVIHREKDNPDNVLATENHYNLEPGKYKFIAKDFEGYELVGDEEVEIVAEEITDPINECKIVIFEYRRIKKGCVIVKFKDRVNDIILDTDYYYDLYPGEHSFNAKEFEGYKLVDDEVKTILVTEEDEKCKEVVFLYEPLVEGCVIGKKIWLFT